MLFDDDNASQALGMRVLAVAEGSATVQMTVRADMVNGHKTCHGGMIFTLADSAFAFACNSRNVPTVASGCSIEFLAPAKEGDILIAEAIEITLAGKTGIYDAAVRNQTGKIIATFRGRSHRLAIPSLTREGGV
jgi:acyl-CoA thioesterase